MPYYDMMLVSYVYMFDLFEMALSLMALWWHVWYFRLTLSSREIINRLKQVMESLVHCIWGIERATYVYNNVFMGYNPKVYVLLGCLCFERHATSICISLLPLHNFLVCMFYSLKVLSFETQASTMEPRSMLCMLIWEAGDESFRRGMRF